jgi:hypothetical protein
LNPAGGFPESTIAVTPCGQPPLTELSILTVSPVKIIVPPPADAGMIIAAPGGKFWGLFSPVLPRHTIVPRGIDELTLCVSVTSNTVAGCAERHTSLTGASAASLRSNSDIRPFRVNVPEAELTELRRRINATRFPERETVTDASQGVQLATIQKLARYWATQYDWRKVEARLKALPQFITNIDGLDIHFIHVRSKHENALPLIVTHGWPGSVIEQLKIIDPLTNPTAHGASASDAFDIVIPSMPGYGF